MKLATIFRNSNAHRVALASAVILGTVGVSNAFAASDTATSSGTVVTPITITSSANLNFGEFAADPTTAGTVVVSTGGVASATTAVITKDTAVTAAAFAIAGSNDASFSVAVTDNEVTHTDTTTTMALTTKHDNDATTEDSLASYALSATGAATIYVGGTLAVAAAQLAGAYSGTVTVAVAYN
ncbi:DUF4402 domain-containing protein [Marinimicrobium sp. C2-29]|uniref:DUF4402 domain-containing protein n=1 Tax=Marinimicrobium sp. C2-29 TaxID=3139825 RepID=UPI0031387077